MTWQAKGKLSHEVLFYVCRKRDLKSLYCRVNSLQSEAAGGYLFSSCSPIWVRLKAVCNKICYIRPRGTGRWTSDGIQCTTFQHSRVELVPEAQVLKWPGAPCNKLIKKHAERVHIHLCVVGYVTSGHFGCSVSWCTCYIENSRSKELKQDCRIVTFLCAVILQFEKDHRSFVGIFSFIAKRGLYEIIGFDEIRT